MKNKRNTYILLVVVLFIWGAVIYRFFNFMDNEEPAHEDRGMVFLPKKQSVKQRKQVVINTRYRDPFLGKLYVDNGQTSKKPLRKRIKKVSAPLPLPNLVYKGLVTDSGNKKNIFMVLINNNIHLLKINETEQGIKILRGNRKEITVNFMGKQHIIALEP